MGSTIRWAHGPDGSPAIARALRKHFVAVGTLCEKGLSQARAAL